MKVKGNNVDLGREGIESEFSWMEMGIQAAKKTGDTILLQNIAARAHLINVSEKVPQDLRDKADSLHTTATRCLHALNVPV